MVDNEVTIISGFITTSLGLANANELASLIFTILGIISVIIGLIPVFINTFKIWKAKAFKDGKISLDEILELYNKGYELTKEQLDKLNEIIKRGQENGK